MPEVPATTYIIASTMRTGSYLLCEGLEATGVAGHPMEVFCPERREDYEGKWELPPGNTFEDFLRTAIERGTTSNGVFGMKIHAHHLESLALESGVEGKAWKALEALFPAAKYVHLRRRDLRAQAISWYRARVTNRWWQIEGVQDWNLTGREALFNAGKIREFEIELEKHQRIWDDFFAARYMDVLEMEYENLAADYRGEVGRVLVFLGLDAALAAELPEPRLMRQSDDTTERWRKLMEAHFPS